MIFWVIHWHGTAFLYMIILVDPSSWEPGRMHYFLKVPSLCCRDDRTCLFPNFLLWQKKCHFWPSADSDMLRWRSFRSWQDDETAPDGCGWWWGVFPLEVADSCSIVCVQWENLVHEVCRNEPKSPCLFIWGVPWKNEKIATWEWELQFSSIGDSVYPGLT